MSDYILFNLIIKGTALSNCKNLNFKKYVRITKLVKLNLFSPNELFLVSHSVGSVNRFKKWVIKIDVTSIV